MQKINTLHQTMNKLLTFGVRLLTPLQRGGLTEEGARAEIPDDIYTDSEAFKAAENRNQNEPAAVTRRQRKLMVQELAAAGAPESAAASETPVDVQTPAPPKPGANLVPAGARGSARPGAKAVPAKASPPARSRVNAVSAAKNVGNGLEPLHPGDNLKVERCTVEIKSLIVNTESAAVYMAMQGDQYVVVKLQPRRHKRISLQVADEKFILSILDKKDEDLKMQKCIAYGIPDGVDAYYALVTHYAGNSMSLASTDGILPEKDILETLSVASDTLWKIHGYGYVHRDIKPDNIAMGGCLLDFGCGACLYDRNDKRKTEGQRQEGTRSFMAIGVHKQEPMSTDDDWYSMLFTMLSLCMQLPWDRDRTTTHEDLCKKKLEFIQDELTPENSGGTLSKQMLKMVNMWLQHFRECRKNQQEVQAKVLIAFMHEALENLT